MAAFPGEVMPLGWLYPDLAAGGLMSLCNGSSCATGFVTGAVPTAAGRLRLTQRILVLAAPLDV